jgi:phosphoribosyl-ATP pyrophosphohydrolase/phosphoribosyl-AMP cyclohydrolase
MRELKIENVVFLKPDMLVPAIVQDCNSGKVLMLGYMNEEAIKKTNELGKVTFYSRSKKRLWTKGEESGNFLKIEEMFLDCDGDAILLKARPQGPTCHTGDDTCWQEQNKSDNILFLNELEAIIAERDLKRDKTSYTASLFEKGINKIAQKVGEEAVELVIESKDNNADLFKGEAADLIFHFMVLLRAKGITLEDIINVLISRHKN